MVVIGVMATIITPWLRKKEPSSELPAILAEFNDLIVFARQEAISNQKIYRVVFQSNPVEPDFVKIEIEQDNPEKPGEKIYNQIFSEYFNTKYDLPSSVRMKAFYKDKKNEFEENKGQGFCFIIPNGLVEPIMIQISKTLDENLIAVTFRMEPFKGEFELIQGHKRPDK